MAWTVIYDACVLYPAPLRDLLMHLAMTGIFQAKWTEDIHEEWMRNVLSSRPDLTRGILIRTKELMNKHAGDCLVIGYQEIIASLHLPDKKDCHVLAAAICSSASVILTYNLKDFPAKILDSHRIQAQHPDDFILDLLDSCQEEVYQAAKLHRASLKAPAKSREEYLNTLRKQRLYQTVERLQSNAENF